MVCVGRLETEISLFGSIPMSGLCLPGEEDRFTVPPMAHTVQGDKHCWVDLIPTLAKGHTLCRGSTEEAEENSASSIKLAGPRFLQR